MPNFNHASFTSPSHTSPSQGTDTPFVIVLHQRDRSPGGDFRPEATVTVRPALRTSGLLAALPPEDAKSLLLLLTFVTANGWCRPALPELAAAMRMGEGKARARMRRLAEFPWRGRPLVTEVGGAAGLPSYAPSPAVVGMEQAAPEPPPAQPLPPPCQPGRDHRPLARPVRHAARRGGAGHRRADGVGAARLRGGRPRRGGGEA